MLFKEIESCYHHCCLIKYTVNLSDLINGQMSNTKFSSMSKNTAYITPSFVKNENTFLNHFNHLFLAPLCVCIGCRDVCVVWCGMCVWGGVWVCVGGAVCLWPSWIMWLFVSLSISKSMCNDIILKSVCAPWFRMGSRIRQKPWVSLVRIIQGGSQLFRGQDFSTVMDVESLTHPQINLYTNWALRTLRVLCEANDYEFG